MTANTAAIFSRRSVLVAGGITATAAAFGVLGFATASDQSATPDASPSASPSSMMNTGTGAAFMHIVNAGDAPDRLIAAASTVAKTVQVHEITLVDGVMKMSELKDGLEIPAGGDVTLEPGGYHIMLINLTQDIAPNSTYALDLTFANAGTTTVTVTVTNDVPTDGEQFTVGDLTIEHVWSRPAPKITAGTGATPEASPRS